ncbi:MAG: ribose-5-phosphate isomerase [Armatimonadetes bacterium]|nr:ribose-5-phosphate isomerase [Armatimonadota bacterium]
MRIALATDHAGFPYKEDIKAFLIELGHEPVDYGSNHDGPVDYPDFIVLAAEAVARDECERGIVFGGSGNGEAIAANKVPGIRCALCWEGYTARMARQHNDANMLSVGARVVGPELLREIVRIWLEAGFDGGRHQRRIEKIAQIEARHRAR